MNHSSIFQRDIRLPYISAQEIKLLLTWLLLPNLFLLSFAWTNNLARPLVNADYLIALVFLLLPYRASKAVGLLVMSLAFLMDVFTLIIQIFPFLDLHTILYFLPFTFTAPLRYLLLMVLMVVGLFAWLWWTWKTAPKLPKFYSVSSILLLLFAAYALEDFQYDFYRSSLMGSNNYYLVHSPTVLWEQTTDLKFHQLMMDEPTLKPIAAEQDYAAKHLLQTRSPKILYIVAESLTTPRTQEMQNIMLQKIQAQPLEFFKTGTFDFAGATVQAELRELCQLNVEGGFALRRLTNNPFGNCLPNQLKQQGYHTVALHGATSVLYDRNNWYPKAGFNKIIFNEHLLDLPRCSPFKGTCDSELAATVIEEFGKSADQPIFLYWLTLTSHSPYSEEDIHNDRFDCQKFGMRPEGDICRNSQLHTQFFDDLSVLLAHPNMKGTEVMIVGDHMPPLMGNEPIHPFLKWQVLPWLHFKVKA